MKKSSSLFFLLLFSPLLAQEPVQEESKPLIPIITKKYAGPIGFNNPVSIMVRQPDQKILVGGNFHFYSGQPSGFGITRLLPTGVLDKEFADKVKDKFFQAYFSSVVLQKDGKIVLGGVFQTEPRPTSPTRGLIRLNPDGSVDSSFMGGAPSTINGIIETILQQENGQLVVGGSFSSLNGQPASGLVRLNADGSFDVTFSSNVGAGVDADGSVETLILEPDQKILVLGSFFDFNNHKVDGLCRLNTDGTLDLEYHPHEKRPFFHGFSSLSPEEKKDDLGPYLPAALREKDGSLILSGEFVSFNEERKVYASRLLRFTSSGTVDFGFIENMSLHAFDNDVQSLHRQADGQILVGSDRPFSRLKANGTHDPVFLSKAGSAINGEILAFLEDPDGKIWIAGEFSGYLGVTVGNIARLNPDGTLDEDFLHANYE